ncbi:MAG: GTPase [Mucinivorans sp.]
MVSIGIYGRTNAGKSTLFNALTGQNIALVAAESGTTTDPVRRAFEIAGFAPVTFIDTAGIDEQSPLGLARLQKSIDTLSEVDLAIYLHNGALQPIDNLFIEEYLATTPHIITDRNYSVDGLLEQIKAAIHSSSLVEPPFFGTRLGRGDTVILVCPLDMAAPAGRLILPQVQALRAALDVGAIALTVQPRELKQALKLVKPRLVVTDSQVFDSVVTLIPKDVELTSFSILLSELKGNPVIYKEGLKAIKELREADRVLILENCSHQVTCQDIGRVKIPKLLGHHLSYTFVSGRERLPSELSLYALAVQCGGCMTTRTVIQRRIEACQRAKVPITNYGMLLKALLIK